MIESASFGKMASMETIGSRIKHLRKDLLGLSQEEFAKQIRGVTRGAVGNWELDKPISRDSLETISNRWHVSLDWLANGQGEQPKIEPAGRMASGLARATEAADDAIDHLGAKRNKLAEDLRGPFPSSRQLVAYGGAVRAGEFLPVDDDYNQDAGDHLVPPGVVAHPAYSNIRQAAWQVSGDSMDQAGILDGMWVVAGNYADYVDKIGELGNGNFVVVERTRNGGSERELTVKEVQFARKGMRLIPRSSNPRHKEFFIRLDEEADNDTEEVKILAVVLSATRDFGLLPR